jgi:hypothetical protein
LDRLLRADGTRFPLPVPVCSQTLVLTAGGLQLTLSGALQIPPNNPLIPVALENALLQVRAPDSFSLTGTLNEASVSAGSITLNFPLHVIVPILPDPYASSLPATKIVSQQQQADLGQLTGTITWSSQTSAEFAFSYQPAARGPQATLPNLLDISSNADQLGIFSLADLPELTIAELTLQAPGFKMQLHSVGERRRDAARREPRGQTRIMYSDDCRLRRTIARLGSGSYGVPERCDLRDRRCAARKPHLAA